MKRVSTLFFCLQRLHLLLSKADHIPRSAEAHYPVPPQIPTKHPTKNFSVKTLLVSTSVNSRQVFKRKGTSLGHLFSTSKQGLEISRQTESNLLFESFNNIFAGEFFSQQIVNLLDSWPCHIIVPAFSARYVGWAGCVFIPT